MMKDKYKVLIISCWSLLIACCLMKLLGANIFIASSENERFIALCNFIDTTFLRYAILFISNVVSCSIYYMAVLKENKLNIKWLIPFVIYLILKFVFEKYQTLFGILDIFMMIFIPIIIKTKMWKRAIIGFILTFAFQLISMFLKFDNFTMFDNNTLIFTILSIDYYIMIILYYLYSIKGKEIK